MSENLSFVLPIGNNLELDTLLPLVSALHYHMPFGRWGGGGRKKD
jgi:hypothetical protein